MKRWICMAVVMVGTLLGAEAQDMAVSTNLMGYVDFGTMNVEASYALARHWCMTAGLEYNPFTWRGGKEGGQMQNRQQTYAVGARYWPWHVYSGWWMAGKAQYQEYNRGGIRKVETREGDRVGGGLTAGYSYMLHKHINLEAGVGVWAGHDWYSVYACPRCGRVVDKGNDFFFLLNDVILSVTYVF